MNIVTLGRLRAKYGGTLEDIKEFSTCFIVEGWHFISEFKDIPDNIKERYSMLRVTNKEGIIR